MKNSLYKNSVAVLLGLTFIFLPGFVMAQDAANSGDNSGAANSGYNDTAANSGYNSTSLKNPLGDGSTLCTLLSTLFNVAVQLGIPVAVVFLVYAGLRFVLARGNSTELNKAKENLKWTLIGIALFFGAWFLAQVVAQTLSVLGGETSNFNTCFLD